MKNIILCVFTIGWLSSAGVFAQANDNSTASSSPPVTTAMADVASPLPLIDMTLLAFTMASNEQQANYFSNMAHMRMKRIMVNGSDWEREAVIQRRDLFKLVNRSLKGGDTCKSLDATIKGLGLVGHISDHQGVRDDIALTAVQNMLWEQLLSCRSNAIPLASVFRQTRSFCMKSWSRRVTM